MKTYEYSTEDYLKKLVPLYRSIAQDFIEALNFNPIYVILGDEPSVLADNNAKMLQWCSEFLQHGFACHMTIDWLFENEADASLFKLAWMNND
jgi:hypothetical protein